MDKHKQTEAKGKAAATQQSHDEKASDAKRADPLTEAQQKIGELTDLLQRLQAEFENYKKRSDKECGQFKEFAEQSIIKDLLPVIDSFEMALKSSKDEGLRTMYAQFMSVMEGRGIKKINPLGEKLDPFRHEVMLHDQDPKKPDNIVTEVFQAGYLLKDKVIRPAMVKVNRHPEEEHAKDDQAPAQR